MSVSRWCGRVEDWRAGRSLDRATFPAPSNSELKNARTSGILIGLQSLSIFTIVGTAQETRAGAAAGAASCRADWERTARSCAASPVSADGLG
jgi:hypothetical protein